MRLRESTRRHSGTPTHALFVMIGLACAPAVAQTRAPDDLTSWWKGENDVLDSSGGNHGTITGAPRFAAGQVNTGFVFDSDDDRVSIPHHSTLNPGADGFTVEFWVKLSPSQGGALGAIVDKSHGFVDNTGWAVQTQNGTIGINLGVGSSWPGAGVSSPVLLDYQWHHVAAIADIPNGRMRLYLDGTLYAGNTFNPAFVVPNNRPLLFGYASGGGSPQRFFRGSLDEVTIYQRALCTHEVREIFAAGAAGKIIAPPPPSPPPAIVPPGFTHWWPGEGNAQDSVDGSHGSTAGSPGFATGYVGQAFRFDSDDDRVTVPHTSSLNPGPNGFTVEFWVRAFPNQPSGLWTVIDKSHGFIDNTGWAFQGEGGTLGFLIGRGGPAPFGNFVGAGWVTDHFLYDYCWHHVAGIYDPVRQRVSFYVDCELAGSEGVLAPAEIANNTRPLAFGYATGAGASPQRFFRGMIDEVTVYDRPLTRAELEAVCHAGAAGKIQIPNTTPIVVITSPADAAIVGSAAVTVTGIVSDLNPTTVTSIPAGIDTALPGGGGNVGGLVTLSGSDGPHTITLSATNIANNTSGTSVSVVLDTTDPVVTVTSPVESSVVGDPSLAVAATIADLTATGVEIGSNTVTLPAGGGIAAATVTLVEGPNTIAVSATDAAGHSTTVLRHVVLDLSAPIVTIDSPTDGTVFGPGGATIGVVATIDDLTATHVTSTPPGIDVLLPASGGIATGAVQLVEGTNTITVTATDATLRHGSSSITVVLDTTPPVVTVAAPAAGAAVRGTVDVQALASDELPGSGVATVMLAIDGNVFATFTSAPFESSLDTRLLNDGPHVVTATATDGKGNSDTATIAFQVDNTAPNVSITAPIAADLLSGTFAIHANVDDAGSGVADARMLVSGVAPTSDGSRSYAVPVASDMLVGSENSTRWLDGPLGVEVRVTDAAGNTGVAAITVRIDNTAPDKSLVSPVDGSTVDGVITIHVQASDPNLAEIRVYVDGQLYATLPTSPLITTYDTSADVDGRIVITAVVVDTANNQATCTATVTRGNLTFAFKPESLNLKAKGGGVVTAHIEGHGLDRMLPLAAHVVELRVPGGNAVPAIGGGVIGDDDADTIPDTVIRFDRATMIAAVKAGIAAHLIPAAGPIPVYLFVDGARVASDSTRPGGN